MESPNLGFHRIEKEELIHHEGTKGKKKKRHSQRDAGITEALEKRLGHECSASSAFSSFLCDIFCISSCLRGGFFSF
jgi:hypothetical protein